MTYYKEVKNKCQTNQNKHEYLIFCLIIYTMYEVEAILDKKYDKNAKNEMYLVKWVGYSKNQSTWQPRGNLKYCQSLVQEFENSRNMNSARQKKNLIEQAKKVPPVLKIIQKKSKKEMKGTSKEKIFESDDSPVENNEAEKLNKKEDIVPEVHEVRKQLKEENEQQKKEKAKQTENITVLGMKRVGIDYEYYVKANGKKEWKNHDWILDNHPRELALFYEKNVIFEGD